MTFFATNSLQIFKMLISIIINPLTAGNVNKRFNDKFIGI